jgi:hypothetical protein
MDLVQPGNPQLAHQEQPSGAHDGAPHNIHCAGPLLHGQQRLGGHTALQGYTRSVQIQKVRGTLQRNPLKLDVVQLVWVLRGGKKGRKRCVI